MKRILVTGANSYIGTSFEVYMKQFSDEYVIDTVDMIDGSWREKSFANYDVIFHVAGIVHIKETKENRELYYRVNRDLVIETAEKAKREGVKQFVFLSTVSVYGMDMGIITRDTVPKPKNSYGISKLQAEEGITALKSDDFKVAIIRPPMVYGDDCKGNYQTLVTIAKKLPVFANYKNQRSMIHVDNLSKFVKEVIDGEYDGIFLPQDPEYVCTCKMVQSIAKDMGKNMKLWGILNPFVSILKHCTTKGKKAFGDLIYKDE